MRLFTSLFYIRKRVVPYYFTIRRRRRNERGEEKNERQHNSWWLYDTLTRWDPIRHCHRLTVTAENEKSKRRRPSKKRKENSRDPTKRYNNMAVLSLLLRFSKQPFLVSLHCYDSENTFHGTNPTGESGPLIVILWSVLHLLYCSLYNRYGKIKQREKEHTHSDINLYSIEMGMAIILLPFFDAVSVFRLNNKNWQYCILIDTVTNIVGFYLRATSIICTFIIQTFFSGSFFDDTQTGC